MVKSSINYLLLSAAVITACQSNDYVGDKIQDKELHDLSDYEKDSLYILNSIKVFVEGVSEENLDKVMSIYDPEFIYTYPTRRRTVSELKKEYGIAFSNKTFIVRYSDFEITEIKIIGRSAYTVVDWNFTISYRDSKKITRNRFYRDIQVWQKQDDDRWLIIRSWQYPIPD